MSNDIKSQVRTFLREDFSTSIDVAQLDDDESLQGSGLIDSFGVLSLITFIEAEFDVHVSDQDVVPENLDSINRIASFVERMRNET